MELRHSPTTDYSSSPPALSSDRLIRNRLLELINSYQNRRLVLLQAPVGFGKTTLLAEYAASTDKPLIWIRLTPAHRDAGILAKAVWSNLTQRFRRLRGALDEPGLDSLPPAGMARTIIQLTSDQVQEEFSFILDDVQQINESEEATTFLNILLQNMPGNTTFFIGGRTLPAVNLASLVIDGEVGGIGSRDLALTRHELARLIEQTTEYQLSETELEELYRSTEGWITGVLLSLKASPGGGRLLEALPSDQPSDYLAKVVIGHQPETLRTFMLRSSILPWMTGAYLDAILGRNDSEEMLAEILRRGLFISSIHSEPKTYEYHPVFRRALLAAIEEEFPDQAVELRNRAAEIFEANEEYAIAFDLLRQIGSVQGAIRIAEKAAGQYFQEGRNSLLLRWAQWLEEHKAKTTSLFAFVATNLMDRSRFDEAKLWIEAAEKSLGSSHAEEKLKGRIHNIKGRLALLTGNYQTAIDEANSAISILEDEEENVLLAGSYRILSGAQLRLGVGLQQAAEISREAVKMFGQAEDLYRQGQALMDLAAILSAFGKPLEAHQANRLAYETLVKFGGPLGIAMSTNNLAVDAHFLGEYDEALRLFSEAIKGVRQIGSPHVEADILYGQADLFSDLGLHAQAGDLYGEALQIAFELDDQRLLCYGYLNSSQLQRRAGNIELAHDWLDRAAEYATHPSEKITVDLLEAALTMTTDPAASVQRLSAILADGEDILQTQEKIMADVYLSHAYHRLGDIESAISSFQSGFNRAQLQGYQQVLASELHHFPEWLEAIRSNLPHEASLNNLFHRIKYMSLLARRFQSPLKEGEKPTGLFLQALGRGNIQYQGEPLDGLPPLPRQLLFFLVDHQPVSRDRILEIFWPNVEADKQASSLYTAVHGLRRTLGQQIVSIQGALYSLKTEGELVYDVAEFERTSQVARAIPLGDARRHFALHEAIQRYSGPYLPEYDEDWVLQRRRALQREFIELLRLHADAAVTASRHIEAEASLRRAIELDPMREDLHLAYMQVLDHLGRRSEIVHHYQLLTDRLMDELGIDPSEKIRRYYQRVIS